MVKARKTGLPASNAVERSAAQWSDQIEQINHAMDPFGIAPANGRLPCSTRYRAQAISWASSIRR